MAVARAKTLSPFGDVRLEVDQRAIVLGAGVAGMTAALGLANQGFEVHLVEQDAELGGMARRLHYTLEGLDVQAYLRGLVRQRPGLSGRHPHDFVGRQDVQGAIGSDSHIPYPGLQFFEQDFFAINPAVLEVQPAHFPVYQGAGIGSA